MDIRNHIKGAKRDRIKAQQIQEEKGEESKKNLIRKINEEIVKLENLDYILTDRRYTIRLGKGWFAPKKRVSIEDFKLEIVHSHGCNPWGGGSGGRGVYLKYRKLKEEYRASITDYLHLDKRKSGYEHIEDWNIGIPIALIWDIQLRQDIREQIKEEKRILGSDSEIESYDLNQWLKCLDHSINDFRKKL